MSAQVGYEHAEVTAAKKRATPSWLSPALAHTSFQFESCNERLRGKDDDGGFLKNNW